MKKLDEGYVKRKFRSLGTEWWEPEDHTALREARILERQHAMEYACPQGKVALDARPRARGALLSPWHMMAPRKFGPWTYRQI